MKQTTGIDVHENDRKSQCAACRTARAARKTLRCTVAAILWALTVTAAPAFAGDVESIDGRSSTQPTTIAEKAGYDETFKVPRISGALYPKIHNKLQQAFPVAVDHLRNNPECRDLFAELGADGLEKLSMTLYRQSTMMLEKRFCRGGAAAFTVIRSPQVMLCKRFASLGTMQAATLIIHESLHYSGMSEWPKDPQGLEPREINNMVKKACGF
jgi:hypothetical protein